MKIAVYTSLYGEKDILRSPLGYVADTLIDYYIFTDVASLNITPYKTIIRPAKFTDIVKNARYFKILGDDLLKPYDILIWHDANIQLHHDTLHELIEKSQNTFLTTFIHPDRNDFYSEAMTCIRTNKDFSLRILKQALSYFFQGLPANNGMYSTGILIKNYKYKSNDILKFWWEQTLKYSRRDQLSLAYMIYKKEANITVLNDNIFKNKFSIYHLHKYNHYKEQFNIMQYNYVFLKKMSFYCVMLLRKIKKVIK